MRALALVVLAAASPALADATVPTGAPAQSPAWILDDELITHAPPGQPKRAEPAPPPAPLSEAPPARGARRGTFENAKCAERESAGPERPLEFVDSTLELGGDVTASFSSARPVVRREPAPRHTKVLHAR
jgi:hypothetical protein